MAVDVRGFDISPSIQPQADRIAGILQQSRERSDRDQQAQEQSHARDIFSFSTSLIEQPPELRRQVLNSRLVQAQQDGNEVEVTNINDMLNLDDAALDADIRNDQLNSGQFLGISPSQLQRQQEGAAAKIATPGVFKGDLTFKDEDGNLFSSEIFTDPNTQQSTPRLTDISGRGAQPVGKLTPVTRLGESATEKSSREITTSEKKELARLRSQFKLKPAVESAVSVAIREAKDKADLAKEGRSNEIAMNVYETATKGLVDALGGTIAGPFAGWIPALTENQQIADGAVAAMAPVLKQLFRAAGEGTFTKDDQEILMAMLPTRKDRPGARVSKLANVDSIIRAKLSIPQDSGTTTGAATPGAQPVQQPKFLGFE